MSIEIVNLLSEIKEQIKKCQIEDVIIRYIEKHWNSIPYDISFPQYCFDNRNIVMVILRRLHYLTPKIADRFKDDRDLVVEALNYHSNIYECISDRLKDDRELAEYALNRDGMLLELVKPEFKDDEKLVKIALENNGSIKFASERLKNCIIIMKYAISLNPYAYKYIGNSLKDNKELAIRALSNYGCLIQYVSPELAKCREMVKVALDQDPFAIKYVDPIFKDDKELILPLLERANIYKCLGPKLQIDRDVVLGNFSSICGVSLEDVPREFCDDKEIVLKAVKCWCSNIEFASDRLKKDKEIALIALKRGSDIFNIDPCLLSDPDIIACLKL